MQQDDFNDLVSKYHKLVMSQIRRFWSGAMNEHAEDISQEVWSKLWESFKKNENNIVNFKSYLYRTVQTTLWDAARALEKHQKLDPIEHTEEPGLEAGDDLLHDRMRLENLVHQLPAEEARMIRAHLQGFNNQEIAALLGTSEGRVRNLLTRIKKKLVDLGGR